MLKILGISKVQAKYLCTEKYRIMVRGVPRKQYFSYLLVTGIKSMYILEKQMIIKEGKRPQQL